jgi:hypothetical protein
MAIAPGALIPAWGLHEVRIFRGFRRLAPPEKQKTGADVMTPGDLRHAAAWLKALSHEAARVPRRRRPVPVIDAAQRVAATVMDRHMPIFIVILPLPSKPRAK